MKNRPLPRVPRLAAACNLLACLALFGMPVASYSADLYWDSDGVVAGNDVDGTGLGGVGNWDTSTSNWWDLAALGLWPNTNADRAFFSYAYSAGVPSFNTVNLSSGLTTNWLQFLRSGYSLLGGDLTLAGTSPTLFAGLGNTATIGSQILGADGLTMTGGGAIRLSNNSNSYTGTTTISNGTLIVTGTGALGTDTSAVVVTGFNPVPTSTTLRSFGGGALLLDGTAGGFTFARDLSLQGQGPIADRSSALASVGNNTVSGTITTGVAYAGTNLNTRLSSANGLLTLSGTLNVLGTAGTTITSFGGTSNQAGTAGYNLTGILTGTGTIEKSSTGTLFLNASDTSGFSGSIRLSSSTASGQSTVRITSSNVLGTRTASGTGGVLDMNAGILEVRMDAPSLLAGGSAANVYQRNTSGTSTYFVDHALGSTVINGTATFGQLAFEEAGAAQFTSRNGYNLTFGAAPIQGGDGDNTFTNSVAGTLTFTGAFWSNADKGGNRTMTIAGNGNTVISGAFTAANTDAGEDHILTKTGSGSLTLTSTGATLDGNVNANGGAIRITDFRSLNMHNAGTNTGQINIGTGTTSGALIIGTATAATAAGLTTSKTVNLAGTTGGASIYANQTGINPVIFNGSVTATGGTAANAKTVTLGGTNTAENIINGAIPNNAAGGTVSLTKVGSGTWVLAGANTYTGTTTIANGILKLKANAATSTVLPSGNAVTFNQVNQFAGSTLEFVGQNGVNNVQTLGTLTTTAGANTVDLTPGTGGTASLTFSSLATSSASTLNFVGGDFSNNKITIAGSNGIISRTVFWNGADFAYRQSNVLRAPNYGVDGGTATTATGPLTSGANQQITGSINTNSESIATLKIGGSHTLTVNSGQTLTITGAGILVNGGSGVITGGTVATGASVLVARTNLATDSLDLQSALTGTGGLMKVGDGTLIISGANSRTGTTYIDDGTLKLSGSGTLSGANVTTNIRQGAILDLNGVSTGTSIAQLNNNGTVTNSSVSAATLTLGNNNGTGTSYGIIEDGSSLVNVTKVGTGAQSWLGSSTYTGVTTIGSTGLVTVDMLADGGSASGVGAASSSAANLVFNGSTGGLVYQGNIVDGNLTLGSRSASTDRLFTLSGTGATLSSTASNGNAVVWSNTGAIAFGVTGPQTLILTGTSTGDNTFNPQLTDSGTGANITSVTKSDTGIWRLGNSNNTYSGATTLSVGILAATDGQGLSSNSNLVFDGGTLYSQGSFNRNIGTAAGEMRFAAAAANTAQFSGGFVGGDSKLTVNWSGTPVWGSTTGFLDARDGLILNGSQARGQGTATSSNALSEVDIAGDFSLGTASGTGLGPALSFTLTNSSANVTVASTAGLMVGQSFTGTNISSGAYVVSINSATQFTISSAVGSSAGGTFTDGQIYANSLRPIRVDDNGNTGADFATISGIISGGAGTGIRKLGSGILSLPGANTYTGETSVYQGTLIVNSLGSSTTAGGSSVGASGVTMDNSNAITIGNGGTSNAILQYVGAGEVSDRKIRINATTGTSAGAQIHADGSGALILTNVANDMVADAGSKVLWLRGTNTAGNMITSQLSNNGGALNVTVDGGATWILTNSSNNFSGTTSVSAGALGIGDNAALGSSTLLVGSGNLFAYGADRTIANTFQQSNNTQVGFLGDYSLTFGTLDYLGAANGFATYSNVASGKAVTLGGLTANAITGNRTWTVDGSGTMIVNGDIVTTTAFTMPITKTGNGVLQLNGTGSDWNGGLLDVDRGTLRIGANEVIPHLSDSGGLTLSPELATGDTATLDLNGQTETVNALTASTDGTVIIDNTAASAATFKFGANNSAVAFGTGIGTYTITDSGAGALSIVKLGNTAATIPTGVTLTYQGMTESEGGGSFTIASPVNGTSGLKVTGNSTLALTGGITAPSAITSIEVGAGSTLSLLDGAGSLIANLTSLSLGVGASGTATLNLNIGDSATDTLTLLTGNSATLGNTITFNMTDAGLSANTTYTLLNLVDGGISSFGTGNMIQGGTPGGFDSMTWNVTDYLVQITTGNLIVGDLFWRGLAGGGTDTTWNANANNWSQDKANTTLATSIPGQGTDVIFAIDSASGAVATTLEQNFKISSLTFEPGTSTPSSVTIAPGTVATNRLEVAPQNSADGVSIAAGGPAAVTISTPFKLGNHQTWNVADAGSVLTFDVASGSLLQGEKNVTKTGAGKVVLADAADSTFNAGATSAFTINGGTLEIQDVGALGTAANSNLASVAINTSAAFYYNGAAGTVANNLTLGGGTLSLGTANQTYSGTVNVSGNSFVNLRDSNSATTSTTGRNITLSGVLSGSGGLTVDSVDTLTAGNAETGQLIISNNLNSWNGTMTMNRGTIITTATNGLGGGNVVFNQLGRIIMRNTDGNTYNLAGTMTFSPSAIGEFSVDNTGALASDFVINQNGLVTLGTGGTGATARFSLADAASQLNLANVVLGGNSSISVEGGDANSLVTIAGVISDGGSGYSLAVNDDAGAWAATNTILRLSGLNTFSGNVTLDSGTLEFTTATDAGAGASSLGQGNAISMAGGTLSFIGGTNQSTNRPITATSGVTLSANGTSGASITYSGLIDQTGVDQGVTFTGTGAGIVSGGLTQVAGTADVVVNSGDWTFQTGTVTVADDFLMNGGTATLQNVALNVNDDIVNTAGTLNLNSVGVWAPTTPSGTSSGLYARGGGIINLGANDMNGIANANGGDFISLGDGTTTGTGTLNTNGYSLSIPTFNVGAVATGYTGVAQGTGTINVTSTATDWGSGIRLYRGSVAANLAGVATILKQGLGDATLSGNNSGLTGTVAATRLDAGNLILDYSTDNNSKISTAVALDMRGATLTVNGSSSAATSQSVASFTMGSGGSNQVDVNAGTGQTAVLNLGAVSRANGGQDGTIRFFLPSGTQSAANGVTTTSPNSTFGLLGTGGTAASTAAYATVDDGSGVIWFATGVSNGTNLNVAPLISTVKDDVTTWAAGDHVTDSTGFTGGALDCTSINSLRFDAASGSDLTVGAGYILNVASGGILVTSNVAGTASIKGGTLVSGTQELVVHQDSSETFEIGSVIRGTYALTKTGTGTLLLSGNNNYSDETEVQEGTLQVVGGNAIGDSSLVTLADDHANSLELLANETIGRLQGGSAATGLESLATVSVGTRTLTINQSANTTYAGLFTGSGSIVMSAASTANLAVSNTSTGFTGQVVVNGGLFQLNGVGAINASSVTINNAGAILFDKNGTTTSGAQILDTTPIFLNSAVSSSSAAGGLWIRRDTSGTVSETIGAVTAASGSSYVRAETTAANVATILTAQNVLRQNNATLVIRGNNMTATSGRRAHFRIDSANEAAFQGAMIGGAGSAGSATLKIVPWAIAEDVGNAAVAAGNMGNSLATYATTTGFRPLDLATEYATFATAGDTNNTRESLAADLTTLSGRTLNSLVIDNQAVASPLYLTGAGIGQTLTNTSGAFLFTVTGGADSTAYSTTLGGFDDGIVTPSGEYLFHVVNPSFAATTTPLLTATVYSPLTSAADITKSGRGALILSGTNTAGGGAKKTTINEGVLEIADLDNIGGNTGNLVFAGGTLRFGAGLTDDISQRTISFLTGGGTIDTNGVDLTMASSLGSGVGGFTKTGAGNLTLNAAGTFTGGATIAGGTLTVGSNNALGSGDLTIGGGGTLALGTLNISHGLVSTSGLDPVISGTGIITASSGFSFNNTDTAGTLVGAVLAGAGGLTKLQANTLTLNGLNTYTGATQVQAGTLAFNTIGNVGGGASALGAPATVENGIIRMGTSTGATGLTYTGSGHSTDRVIDMAGTTGGVTISSDGTGALVLASVHGANVGAKTLTLGGSSVGFDNVVSLIDECVATLSVLKSGANTWVYNGTNLYTGTTSVNEGFLRLAAGQTLTGALQFGSANSITTAGTLEVKEDSSFGSMLAQTNSAVNTSMISIDAGKVLTINGNVTLGSSAATSTTLISASGGGSVVVNNLINTGNTFLVGGTGSSNVTTADFSAIPTMTVSLNTTGGTFQVSSSSGTNSTGYAILKLAPDTTITANALTAGGGGTYNGNAGQVNQLRLGSGNTIINANSVNIGTGARDLGSIAFDGGSGTVTVRAADGTSAAAFNMGTGSATTGAALSGNQNTFDVTGHNADLKFGAVTIGNQNRNADLANVFSFDTGTLEIGTLNASSKGANGSTTTTTINLGGGTVTTGTWTLASTSGNGNAVANANLTGGTITFSGNINRGTDSVGGGTATGTVNLNGATLNMAGNSIGTSTEQIAFNAQSGTLQNLAELNGGGTLTKSTAGTLILDTANSYTGQTAVTGGILAVSHAGALGGTANGTSATTGGTVSLSNNITVAGEALTLTAGAGGEAILLSQSGNNAWSGNLTVDTGADGSNRVRLLSSAGANLLVSGNVNLSAGTADFVVGGDGNGEISGTITGSQRLFKSSAGTGTWILSNDNSATFTGKTAVGNGTLQVSAENNLGATPGSPVADQLRLGGGSTQGTLRTTADMSLSANRGVSVNTGGGALSPDGSTTLTVASAITGAGVLQKTGAGTVILENDNGYTGGTTVTSGTLLANNTAGSATGTGIVTVNGGTLGGSGTIAGATTIYSGASLTAGTAGGVESLAFGGDLTTVAGSTWLVDFVSGLADFVDVQSGALSLGGAISIVDDGSWVPYQSYQIASYSSLTGSFSNALTSGIQVGNFFIDYGSGTSDFITLTAVPEPETWVPALLVLILGLGLHRRRRR